LRSRQLMHAFCTLRSRRMAYGALRSSAAQCRNARPKCTARIWPTRRARSRSLVGLAHERPAQHPSALPSALPRARASGVRRSGHRPNLRAHPERIAAGERHGRSRDRAGDAVEPGGPDSGPRLVANAVPVPDSGPRSDSRANARSRADARSRARPDSRPCACSDPGPSASANR
jgi:hypothetical protein